jgi:hypothetical protein
MPRNDLRETDGRAAVSVGAFSTFLSLEKITRPKLIKIGRLARRLLRKLVQRLIRPVANPFGNRLPRTYP